MWNNPRLLNAAAGFLTALALLALLAGALHWLARSALFPLREIAVHGALLHADPAELRAATLARVRGNFLTVDLASVRASLETQPWVRRVTVRRVWPDRLEVRIEEHVALARWGDDALVNIHGERFSGDLDARLPVFAGPAGTEGELARRYRAFGKVLAPLGAGLNRVVLTPRHAWRLELDSGLGIVLGRDVPGHSAEARLARFVALYPETLGKLSRRPLSVDLRYPNGFALQVPGLDQDTPVRGTGKG
ncbi:MAG TPA: cell division protein FtsQ/DivIB [Burkholderiales bacterium]